MDNSDSPIAVIGGSGFIGTVLIKLLLNGGHQVRVVDIVEPPASSSRAQYHQCDITNLSLLVDTLRGCSSIVNLAAKHRDDVRPISLYHAVNVQGAENVCRAAEELGISEIVFTSSVAVYGLPQGIPDEETAPAPFNPYGETKLAAERVYRTWQERDAGARRLEIVRPTVVFGPGNRGNVYNLLSQLTRSKFVMIGKGYNRKSMAFVGNVASFLAFVLFGNKQPGVRLFNYCDVPAYTMSDLLHEVRTVMGEPTSPFATLPYWLGLTIGKVFDFAAMVSGRSFPISSVRVRKFCANTHFSSARAEATGFKAPFNLQQALHQTISVEFPDKMPKAKELSATS